MVNQTTLIWFKERISHKSNKIRDNEKMPANGIEVHLIFRGYIWQQMLQWKEYLSWSIYQIQSLW